MFYDRIRLLSMALVAGGFAWLVNSSACAGDAGAPTAEQRAAEMALREKYPGYQGCDADYLHAGDEAIERWMDLKVGIRIHWGVYSVLGVEASWSLMGASEEYQKLYHTLYQSFNPVDFNAEEWMDLFERGGIKYFTITAMHCDGFCLWPTERKLLGFQRPVGGGSGISRGVGPVKPAEIHYSIAETPYRKDILKQLVEAARKKNIAPGFYFSHENWLDPDFGWHRFDASNVRYDKPRFTKADDPARWQRFIDKQRLQLEELAANYGPLNDISFDCAWPTEAFPDLVEITKMIRKHQPAAMLRNRGIQQYGDYGTPEQIIPESGDMNAMKAASTAEGRFIPWQVIYHIGRSWAYLPNDEYQSKEWTLATVIDVVAKGGNIQLGFGPTGMGTWAPEMVEQLKYLGDWLKVNGEAIYGTRPWKFFKERDDIRFTRSKDGKYVYLICLKWPGREIRSRLVTPAAGSKMTMLGREETIEWRQEGNELMIVLPEVLNDEPQRPCKQAYVFKVEAKH